MATASQGGSVAWVVPTYANGRSLWRWAENVTANLRANKYATANKTERVIEFPTTGGLFGIYSADSEDSIRGEKFHLVVIDEAARVSESTWTDVIQPTLADYAGDAILISTPKGLNWFHDEWVNGKDCMNNEFASWQAPSRANPNPLIRAAYEKASHSDRIPTRTFQQEWNAEFVADGAYFQNVDNACTITQPDLPEQHSGHYVVGGLDWALSEDYTVLTLSCRDCNRVIFWYRDNKIDYTWQRARIIEECQRYNVSGLLPERNSIGEPNIEMLMQAGVRILQGPGGVYGFNTTATTKPDLIQRLAGGLEHGGFKVPADYADELRSYEVETLASGHPKFGAPSGQHDDRVMSLALAWYAMSNVSWLIS
jgi:hypothetical protein